MRRWSLVLLLATASPVLAQEAQEAPAAPAAEPAPAPAAPAAEQAPAAAEGTPAAQKPSRRRRAKQEAAAEAPAPAPEAPAPAPTAAAPGPAPAPSAPAAAPQPGSIEEVVRDEARYLLSYLLTGDVRSTVPMLTFPFQLEERRFDAPEPLVVSWVKQLRNKRTDLVTLYDIEVLPYAELEKRYGKPPARLGAIVPRGTDVYAAVANLSGHAAVLLYRLTGEGWKAFAYTD
ncbi:hypothetical protein JQX13_43425 [Archangium violaceum]|uniref:hypothetical protein n=1 Tax=Archangium violaceum TaxID=83451 RepID=UPI00193C1229|nr:hypothetical protein [Archangium violaceum]QRK06846.1 hypothetical protein JQX13_43425 [Archangium violaceum]